MSAFCVLEIHLGNPDQFTLSIRMLIPFAGRERSKLIAQLLLESYIMMDDTPRDSEKVFRYLTDSGIILLQAKLVDASEAFTSYEGGALT